MRIESKGLVEDLRLGNSSRNLTVLKLRGTK